MQHVARLGKGGAAEEGWGRQEGTHPVHAQGTPVRSPLAAKLNSTASLLLVCAPDHEQGSVYWLPPTAILLGSGLSHHCCLLPACALCMNRS